MLGATRCSLLVGCERHWKWLTFLHAHIHHRGEGQCRKKDLEVVICSTETADVAPQRRWARAPHTRAQHEHEPHTSLCRCSQTGEMRMWVEGMKVMR